ncbi:response regulator [Myxosarcina sp. GI1]|uniref:response regulator n=1 Tax=Myxosarcina sp. GI1 TaxID=1541065 RepID=UPI000560A546|nr:response regulator [Myxosarcina sp. GI1]
MKQERPLLIIEDSDEDFAALTRMMNKAKVSSPIYRCEDGEEALEFLYHQGEYEDATLSPRPSLIILDLNLPGTNGREVLAELKQDNTLKSIPVIIFSTSSNPKDINACYHYGISGYIVKPMGTNRLNEIVQTFLDYWFQTVELPDRSFD